MAGLFPLLPVFVDLAGRSAAILSADAWGARLAAVLLDAGAGVTLYDPAPCAAAEALAPPARLVRRRWRSADLRASALVAAGARERQVARARRAAREANAVFLTAEARHGGDIILGEAAARGPLALGVSTDRLPADLGAAVMRRVEAAAPVHLGGFFQAAARHAGNVEAALPDGAARAAFWERALAEAASAHPADWGAWLLSRV